MDNELKYSVLVDWAELICSLSLNGQSTALGLFNANGQLLSANAPMCFFLGTTADKLQPANQFINPLFSSFTEGEGLVFDGYMTIGNYSDTSFVLLAKVFSRNSRILVFAEANVPELFEENKKMSQLNQQVNNLQRQLIREKKNLQSTLAQLKETQQMLIHSEKMNALGQLVAGVAHEVNNPISFVYSNLHSLQGYVAEVFQSYDQLEGLIGKTGNEKLIGEAAQIRKENDVDFLMDDIAEMTKESKVGIERVRNIVEDLRRFSRLDESNIKHIDLVENIRSTIAIARAEINKKNIGFSFIAPEKLMADCYPGQLNQAILNVLLNAVQAVGSGGVVSLSLAEIGENVSIAICDNGPGIPAEIQQRIFDPFFTTKPVGSGTGLGLSITYKIISDLHKGKITVDSEPDKGTVFTIFISTKQNI
jgi:two-component system, NtrC family, sensor kinase